MELYLHLQVGVLGKPCTGDREQHSTLMHGSHHVLLPYMKFPRFQLARKSIMLRKFYMSCINGVRQNALQRYLFFLNNINFSHYQTGF